MSAGQLKQFLITAAKLGVSAVLIAYLAWRASGDDQFQSLLERPKDWSVLVLALPICLLAVTATILRWHFLIWALGLKFTVRETLRAGFLAYLANLLPLGLVAGDSLKAVMLIHRNPRRKTEAVAAVLVDRVLGLFALLLLAAIASLFLPAEQIARLAPRDQLFVQRLCWVVQGTSLLSTLGLVVMLIPAVTRSGLWDKLEHAPLVGRVLHKLVGAMRAYRQRVDLLLAAIGLSLVIHTLYVSAICLMSMSIGIPPDQQPAWGSIFVIVPPSMIAGALPIGVYEITITLLFQAISPPSAPQNMGLLIALAYRLIQISIATIGVGYWLAGRSEVRELMHEAEEQPPEAALNGDDPPPPDAPARLSLAPSHSSAGNDAAGNWPAR
ncbi:MAG TPA: lysylphosphatidylglycerol synthase transmembrane domain-containing protein [Pirellulaceae bacterium]|nr:lysylphosphatidylglycerol synthase transmembrane domain-containing protein [Pirellulaceae bacterium]